MTKLPPSTGLSRRRFLAATGVLAAAPMIVPRSVFGGPGKTAPSERITMGVVGWGMMGPGNTHEFLSNSDCQVVAACDLDKKKLQHAMDTVNGKYGNKDCAGYHDVREMFARKDIDAVMLAVPDHWHALVATEAAKQKKDIYGEKPLARTIHEQQEIVRAVEKNKRIWQTGSWQRSQAPFRRAAEIVRSGMIGKITHVEVGLPAGHTDFAKTAPAMEAKWASLPDKPTPDKVTPGTEAWKLAISDPPPNLDYNMWIGPSKMEPYIEARVHMNWRWNYNTGGGQLLDWIGHHCDIAHWGMDADRSGPLDVEGHGDFPAADAIWNTATKYRITAHYPNDIVMTIAGGYDDIKGGTKWIGTEGWVYVNRGAFDASNVDWFTMPEDQYKVQLYKSENHQRNFLDCVKSRKPTITPVETAHHSAIPGHLGLIAMMVGRKIKWDSKKEKIIGDSEASKLLTRNYRSPWKL
jgi:predicted dehydrogenase